jgi:hypothetical protein
VVSEDSEQQGLDKNVIRILMGEDHKNKTNWSELSGSFYITVSLRKEWVNTNMVIYPQTCEEARKPGRKFLVAASSGSKVH